MEPRLLRAAMIFSKSEAAIPVVSGAPADAVAGSWLSLLSWFDSKSTRSIQKEQTSPQGNPKLRVEKQSRVKVQEGNQQIQNTQFKTMVLLTGVQ